MTDYLGIIEGSLIVASITPIFALYYFVRDMLDKDRRKDIKVIWFEWLIGNDNCDCDDCVRKRKRWCFR